jgi:hypothetical protein
MRAGVGVRGANALGEALFQSPNELPFRARERSALDRRGEREHFLVAQIAACGILVGGELDSGRNGRGLNFHCKSVAFFGGCKN